MRQGSRTYGSPRMLCRYVGGNALVKRHPEVMSFCHCGSYKLEKGKDLVQKRAWAEGAWPFTMKQDLVGAHGEVIKSAEGLMTYKSK